jgi:hypothetical protein
VVALQIRDVPDDVRTVLAERAKERGQSLQAFLLGLVEAEARRAGNAAVLARFANRSDGSHSARGATAAEVASDRERRAAELT